MTDLRVIPWIRGLDETRAVALARSLIHAEAGRLGLPLADFTMSDRVKARDQGIDGRTHFPEDRGALLSTGPQVWQAKSGSTALSAAKEFDQKHAGLIKAIQDGYDYVLFWTNDPVDPTATTIKDSFRQAVQAIRPDAEATFLFADAIERLCYAHLAVLAQSSTLPLGGVVSINTWGRRQDFDLQFQYDDQRRSHVEALRAHVGSEDPASSVVNLYGDTGVGKSRLVYEALTQPGVAERVLVTLDPADLDRSLLTLVAESDERRLILVIDDCTAADRQAVTRYADIAQGRIRLVTIGSRYTRDPHPTDARYLEVLPLAIGVSREIALSVGLSETDADAVAHYTEGYPKLALILAHAIAQGGVTGNLLDRIRSEPVGLVLSSLLTNQDDILLLGGLALFDRLGYDGDLAPETTIACELLGIDEDRFREVVDRELRRFVSNAGRYRQVTPRLFAVWLASEFIRTRPTFADVLQQLPETLRDRMLDQMKAFAGDRYVSAAIRRLLELPPFTTRILTDMDAGSARLLHIAAIVDPAQAMKAIESTIAEHPTEELRSGLSKGRRGYVNALEVLIWFDETFDRAASVLLRLALAENETWSTNATGILHGIFRIHLGGTSVSYPQRLAWVRQALSENPEADSILVPGLANALQGREMRTNPDFASRTAPPEWRPQHVAEEIAARRGAWDILVSFAQAGRSVEAVADAVASGLRTAARRGLAQDVLSGLRSVDWPPSARVRISKAIDHLLEYDNPDPDVAAQFRDLRVKLIGATRNDQLVFLLNKAPWELYEDGRTDRLSPFLTDLAAQLATSGFPTIMDTARKSRSGNFQTSALLFEHIAAAMPDTTLQLALESEEPLPEAAVLGSLVGFTKTAGAGWGTDQLQRWLEGDLSRLVIHAAHILPPSDELAELAVQAVLDGGSDAGELGRFLYGGWARDLSVDRVVVIADLLRRTEHASAIEQALGILSQWLDQHPDSQVPELNRVAIELITTASEESDQDSSMIPLFRQKVLARLDLPFETQLEVISKVLSRLRSFIREYDLQMLTSLATRDPARTIPAVIALILGEGGPGGFTGQLYLQDAKILTRLAAATSPEDVIRGLESVPSNRWRELVAHVDFSLPEPDVLIETLVTKSTDEVVPARAAFSFMYPENAWFGHESEFLRKRRTVALSWLDNASSPIMQQWLRDLAGELDARIAAAVLTEAEEGL